MKDIKYLSKEIIAKKKTRYLLYSLGIIIVMSVITLLPPLDKTDSSKSEFISKMSPAKTTLSLTNTNVVTSHSNPGSAIIGQDAGKVDQASSSVIQGSAEQNANTPARDYVVPTPTPGNVNDDEVIFPTDLICKPIFSKYGDCHVMCPDMVGGCFGCGPFPRMIEIACLIE